MVMSPGELGQRKREGKQHSRKHSWVKQLHPGSGLVGVAAHTYSLECGILGVVWSLEGHGACHRQAVAVGVWQANLGDYRGADHSIIQVHLI